MLFSDWIRKEGINGDTFAERAGIPRSTVYRALRFPWKGLRADTALRISETTRGEVSLAELVPVSRLKRPPRSNGEGVSG